VAYALFNLEDRGPMMIDPGTKVYPGMIIGEHTRGNDLEVNVLKGKQLTNIRPRARTTRFKLTTADPADAGSVRCPISPTTNWSR
jgi:GTP-binding protein